ncbi:MAG: hypothetical protein KC417_08320 [Myxococcales bacterium]|nr:hypothetical protein [Myxococcales bacterium]
MRSVPPQSSQSNEAVPKPRGLPAGIFGKGAAQKPSAPALPKAPPVPAPFRLDAPTASTDTDESSLNMAPIDVPTPVAPEPVPPVTERHPVVAEQPTPHALPSPEESFADLNLDLDLGGARPDVHDRPTVESIPSDRPTFDALGPPTLPPGAPSMPPMPSFRPIQVPAAKAAEPDASGDSFVDPFASMAPPAPAAPPAAPANTNFDPFASLPPAAATGAPAGDAWGTLPPPLASVEPPPQGEKRNTRPYTVPSAEPEGERAEAREVVSRSKPPSRPPGRVDLASDMRDRLALDDFTGALRAAELVLGSDPNNAEARGVVAACRERLSQMYLSRVGSTESVPQVIVPDAEIRWLGLDHRAGFLLSRVDGMSTVDEIIDMSGMERLEALKILAELVEANAIRLMAR